MSANKRPRETASRRKLHPKRRTLEFQELESRQLMAADVQLVTDLNALKVGGLSFNNATSVGAITFFTSPTPTSQPSLWKTDGTTAGTVQIKSFYDGVNSRTPAYLTNVNGVLFFNAFTEANGYELWKSDGTTAGTVLVKDLSIDNAGAQPSHLTNVNGTLFFSATDFDGVTTNGSELWKSDGTAAGTSLVKDIRPGVFGTNPSNLTNLDGTLFFSAGAGTNGKQQLYKSDGTAAGTVLVKDFPTSFNPQINSLINVNNALLFTADDGNSGVELWRSDGTDAGTIQVADLWVGINSSAPSSLTNINNTLFFAGRDDTVGRELWSYVPATSTLSLVKDLYPGAPYLGSNPESLTNLNGTLFFVADDGGNGSAHGKELWMSNGTSAGTSLVKDIVVGLGDSNPLNLLNFNGTLLFTADDGVVGRELWKSDGSASGTTLVRDINSSAAGTFGNNPVSLIVAGDKALFPANDGINGVQLWSTDGTLAGTSALTSISSTATGSIARERALIGNDLFFFGSDGTNTGLWKTTGTAASTVFLSSFGAAFPQPASLTEVSGTLFFSANGTGGTELWKSDGTAAGTVRVKDITPGDTGYGPLQLTNVAGTLFFLILGSSGEKQLWKSDGSEAGTVLVTSANTSATPSNFTAVGSKLFFTFTDPTAGEELWISDGTAPGTKIVKDVIAGSASGMPRYLTNVSGTLFFRAGNTAGNFQLWKSDGTAAGTTLVSTANVQREIFNANGTTFFSVQDNSTFQEQLWKSDGTTAGTTKLADVALLSASSFGVPNIANLGGTIYFGGRGAGAATDSELWKSDGTVAGTKVVKDILPGPGSSIPADFTAFAGNVYFKASDGVHGYELWKTDGTAAGTVLVTDLAPQGSSSPKYLSATNGTLFFTATTDAFGQEIFTLSSQPPVIGNFGNPLAFTENQGQRTLASVATLADPDSTSFAGGTLTVTIATGANVNDRLEIRDFGAVANRIGLSGTNVTFNNVVIGTFAGGSGVTPLTITLNSASNLNNVRALLRAITFRTLGDTPSTANRTINFILSDGEGGTSNLGTKQVTVAAVNDRPVLALGGTTSYTENQPAKILATTTTVTDVDSPNFAGGNLTVRVALNVNANDRLEISSQGTAAGQVGVSGNAVSFGGTNIGTFTGGSGNQSLIISFNASATPAAVQSLTQRITFRTLGDTPSTAQRKITWIVSDGDGAVSSAATKLVNVVAVKDAPVLAGTTSTLGYTRGSAALLIAASLGVTDVDSANFNSGKLVVSGGQAGDLLAVSGAFSLAGNTVNFTSGTTTTAIGTRNANGGVGAANLTITLNASATTSIVQQLLKSIRFSSSLASSAGARTISFTTTDDTGVVSNTLTRTINVS